MLSITCVTGRARAPSPPVPDRPAVDEPPKPVTWWIRMLSIFSAGFIIWR
jgi:hypothetical protein